MVAAAGDPHESLRRRVLLVLAAAYLTNTARFVVEGIRSNGWNPLGLAFSLGSGLLWLPIALVAAGPLVFSSPEHAWKLFLFVAFGIDLFSKGGPTP